MSNINDDWPEIPRNSGESSLVEPVRKKARLNDSTPRQPCLNKDEVAIKRGRPKRKMSIEFDSLNGKHDHDMEPKQSSSTLPITPKADTPCRTRSNSPQMQPLARSSRALEDSRAPIHAREYTTSDIDHVVSDIANYGESRTYDRSEQGPIRVEGIEMPVIDGIDPMILNKVCKDEYYDSSCK